MVKKKSFEDRFLDFLERVPERPPEQGRGPRSWCRELGGTADRALSLDRPGASQEQAGSGGTEPRGRPGSRWPWLLGIAAALAVGVGAGHWLIPPGAGSGPGPDPGSAPGQGGPVIIPYASPEVRVKNREMFEALARKEGFTDADMIAFWEGSPYYGKVIGLLRGVQTAGTQAEKDAAVVRQLRRLIVDGAKE